MKENFDFNKIGKRMPYNVPDAFFDKLEDNVWQDVKPQTVLKPKRKNAVLRIVATAMTTAAVIVMAFILTQKQPVGYNDVEQAFNNLSQEDQTYMLSVYQDDIFINE